MPPWLIAEFALGAGFGILVSFFPAIDRLGRNRVVVKQAEAAR
ncbi:MAG TPA: hypothetical protein VMI93_16515 [Candidatus Solibacter sp.]|nr:hypothetical protein [Candidatus Solibacter sp.]